MPHDSAAVAKPSLITWLHRLAVLSAVTCFALLFLGGLVTSNQAGLSVPDWPTSFYMNMYAFPIKDWIGGIFFEHTHRLFASLVGLIILVQAVAWQIDLKSWWKKGIWAFLAVGASYMVYQFASLVLEATSAEPGYAIGLTVFLLALSIVVLMFVLTLIRASSREGRPQAEISPLVRKLAWTSLIGVVIQGILGGLTVKYYLPVSISTSHATLGQSVFCMTLALAVITGRRWKPFSEKLPNISGFDVRQLSLLTTSVVVLQLIIGAVMRHTQSGLAIPTFPHAFGQLVPDFTSFGVVINFAHRVGALCVTILLLTTCISILRHHGSLEPLRRPAILALVLLAVQISLGAIVIWNRMPVTPTTLHVSTGAAILGTMFYITIQSRHLVAARRRVSSAVHQASVTAALSEG